MDNDTLRRGRPTLHVVYGDGIAILAGDGLQAEAFSLLAREPVTADAAITQRKLLAIDVIAHAAGTVGMVGGQAIDLQAAGQAPGHALVLDGDGLQRMHARKTGALIRASAVSGAVMAGAGEGAVTAIDRFATDVEASSAELGKTAGKDAAGTKPTYPALFGVDRSRTLAAECLERARETLRAAALDNGWLVPIAEWVVNRRS